MQPALTSFLVTARDFRDVQIRPLHPKKLVASRAYDCPGSASRRRTLSLALTKAFFGPQDYAIVATRP